MSNEKYEVLQYFPLQTTTPNLTPPGTSPPSEGLGEAQIPLSFIPFHPPSKTATSSLFAVHLLETNSSTREKQPALQYYSTLNLRSKPYPARYIPSFGGAWGGSASLSILFCRGLGRPPFHFSNISVHSPTCSQILKI